MEGDISWPKICSNLTKQDIAWIYSICCKCLAAQNSQHNYWSKMMWSFVIFSDIKQLRVSKAFQIMQMVWNRGFFSIVACQRDWAEAPPNNLYICQIMRFREMLDFPDFINWELDTPFHLLGTTTWSKTSKNATKMQLFSETSWSRFISNLLECLGLWCWLSGSR